MMERARTACARIHALPAGLSPAQPTRARTRTRAEIIPSRATRPAQPDPASRARALTQTPPAAPLLVRRIIAGVPGRTRLTRTARPARTRALQERARRARAPLPRARHARPARGALPGPAARAPQEQLIATLTRPTFAKSTPRPAWTIAMPAETRAPPVLLTAPETSAPPAGPAYARAGHAVAPEARPLYAIPPRTSNTALQAPARPAQLGWPTATSPSRPTVARPISTWTRTIAEPALTPAALTSTANPEPARAMLDTPTAEAPATRRARESVATTNGSQARTSAAGIPVSSHPKANAAQTNGSRQARAARTTSADSSPAQQARPAAPQPANPDIPSATGNARPATEYAAAPLGTASPLVNRAVRTMTAEASPATQQPMRAREAALQTKPCARPPPRAIPNASLQAQEPAADSYGTHSKANAAQAPGNPEPPAAPPPNALRPRAQQLLHIPALPVQALLVLIARVL